MAVLWNVYLTSKKVRCNEVKLCEKTIGISKFPYEQMVKEQFYQKVTDDSQEISPTGVITDGKLSAIKAFK